MDEDEQKHLRRLREPGAKDKAEREREEARKLKAWLKAAQKLRLLIAQAS